MIPNLEQQLAWIFLLTQADVPSKSRCTHILLPSARNPSPGSSRFFKVHRYIILEFSPCLVIAFSVFKHDDFSNTDIDYFKSHMAQLTKDVPCMRFEYVSNLSKTSHTNGILFVPGSLTGGGCWSAVGLAPNFGGRNGESVTDFGAPSGWQIISIDSRSCIGPSHERSVQHEGKNQIILPWKSDF